jgi:hypothetical protein
LEFKVTNLFFWQNLVNGFSFSAGSNTKAENTKLHKPWGGGANMVEKTWVILAAELFPLFVFTSLGFVLYLRHS